MVVVFRSQISDLRAVRFLPPLFHLLGEIVAGALGVLQNGGSQASLPSQELLAPLRVVGDDSVEPRSDAVVPVLLVVDHESDNWDAPKLQVGEQFRGSQEVIYDGDDSANEEVGNEVRR